MLLICVIVGGENLVWPYWTRILVGVVYREIYVPLHRYNLKYSRNSSSCWTRLRCYVHSYSGTCIVLHRMPFYYQTFWVWYTRRTFSVHVSDLWAFIHCTRGKTLQNELQGPKICVTIIRLKLIHWDPSSPTAFYDIDDHNRIRRKNL